MKYTLFFLLLLGMSLPKTAYTQNSGPSFCAEMLGKAKTALKNKEYGKSRDYCEAAVPLCPDYADQFGKVLAELNTAIESEKKKAKDGERKARLALAEQQKAMEAQQAALTEIARRTVRDAQTQIYHLDYEGSLATLKTAVALHAAQKEISDALLEIAFFFAETGHYARAKGVLDTAAQLAGRTLTSPSGGWETRAAFRAAIKTINPDADTFFAARYFPTMLPIPGGTDTLGSAANDTQTPSYEVTLSAFKMAKTETTWWQYNLFCEATKTTKPNKPGWGSDGDNPVINVSWYDAVAYANWLSERDGRRVAMVKIGSEDNAYEIKLQSNGYRLPTEVEWEYAARAQTPYQYAGSDTLDAVAWYGDHSSSRTHPVAGKKSNAFGLYDMTGNVGEWCEDDWHDSYKHAPLNDGSPAVDTPDRSTNRVLRGGSWTSLSQYCRIAYRYYWLPHSTYMGIGFRLCIGSSEIGG